MRRRVGVGSFEEALGDHLLKVALDQLARVEVQDTCQLDRTPCAQACEVDDGLPELRLPRALPQVGDNALDLCLEPPPIRA